MADEQGREGQRDWGGDTAALGGYGSAGLFSRRRQMERTQGGSYSNLSNITRGQAPGGYASMPTVGPEPQATTPFFGKAQGPSGPSAMAQGVAPNFSGSIPNVPRWGQTAELLGKLSKAGLVSALTAAKKPDPPQPEPDVPPFTSRTGGRYGRGPEGPKGLPSGPTRPALGAGEILEGEIVDPDEYTAIGGRKAIGAGSNVIDVDSVEIVGELGSGMPIAELEASQQRALGRASIPMGGPDRGPGQQGGVVSQPRPDRTPAVVSGRAGRVRSRPTTVVMQGEGGSLAQTAVGEVVSRQVQERRQQQQVAELASNIEYPNAQPTNEYLGQSAGRRATRGERNARNTPQQGQLPGMDWREI